MSTVVAKCPSGLEVELRGLEVREANVLADRQEIQGGTLFDSVLRNCTIRLVEPGPYKFAEAVDWSEVHVGDRMYALIQIRRATYPRPYEFRLTCAECREPIDWTIDLAEIPVKPLPEAAREALRGDRILSAKWPQLEDRVVRFRLVIGKDAAKVRRIAKQRPKELALVSLLSRVVAVEGVEESKLAEFLSRLGGDAMVGLMEILDECDGGVDTEIQVVCPHCGALQDVELPFGRAYWLPKARRATIL